MRVGRIDGEFVVNPTYSQLEESELDLVVSGTRDAIMMVEAGAKILPEDVMAEAILFGHRALRRSSTSRSSSARPSASPSACRTSSPATDSVLEFARAIEAERRVRRLRRRDHRHATRRWRDLVEIAAVRVKGGKITDRWSTLVNPGRPIVGNQMHGITDKDVKGAPSPQEAAAQVARLRRATRSLVGHNVGFDIGFLEAALGDGTRFEPGTLPRHAGHRARGATRTPSSTSSATCHASSASS